MGKLEKFDKAQKICLMYKLISSSKDSDDLSSGFHRSFQNRENEMNKNATTGRNYDVKIFLMYVFIFAEHQQNDW